MSLVLVIIRFGTKWWVWILVRWFYSRTSLREVLVFFPADIAEYNGCIFIHKKFRELYDSGLFSVRSSMTLKWKEEVLNLQLGGRSFGLHFKIMNFFRYFTFYSLKFSRQHQSPIVVVLDYRLSGVPTNTSLLNIVNNEEFLILVSSASNALICSNQILHVTLKWASTHFIISKNWKILLKFIMDHLPISAFPYSQKTIPMS